MKKLNKIFKTALVFSLISSTLFGAYACKNDDEEETPKEENKPTDNVQENITATEDFLLQNGATAYKLVYPADASVDELNAVAEINFYFKEATGVAFETVSDASVGGATDDSKYIYLGDNAITKQKGIVPDVEEYTVSGYVIQTHGNGVHVVGATDRATVFAAYKFLYYTVGYEYFYDNVYSLNRGTTEIALMDYDVSVVYDAPYGFVSSGTTNNDATCTKYSVQRPKKSLVRGAMGHNSMSWLPVGTWLNPNDLENYHWEWYMGDWSNPELLKEIWIDTNDPFKLDDVGMPTQLCYTAHGDAAEFDLMTSEAAKTLIDIFKADETAYFAGFTMSDDYNWCDCETCEASSAKYGATSAAVVQFLNAMTEKVAAWMETEEGKPYKRDFWVDFYAYYGLTTAPVQAKLDTETNKFSFTTVDDTVYCNEYVAVTVADLFMDYTQSIYAEVNYDSRASFESWAHVCQRPQAYLYSARYHDYMVPLESFSDMQELYCYLRDLGYVDLYNLNAGDYGWSTGWNALRYYLGTKLVCDVDLNMEEYIDRFFDNVYLDASKTMRKLFDEWRMVDAYNSANFKEYVGRGSHYTVIKKKEYFSDKTLKKWKGYIDQAVSEIEYLKAKDPALYEKTYKMIVGERIWIDYLHFEIYRYNMSEDELTKVKNDLVGNIKYMGVTHHHEGLQTPGEISFYLESIGG